jgi:DNA mismatch repair protein MutH
LLNAKGWIGQLIEHCLGAQAGSLPMPDFPHLGVELKTIPVNRQGKPQESTYVCVAPLTAEPGLRWETSLVWQKLQRVLWMPILAEAGLTLAQRLIGTPLLWQPDPQQTRLLRRDWEELITLISLGRVAEITAQLGSVLQIRPKAANNRALTRGVDAQGQFDATLPRGFYLRPHFTQQLLLSR